MTTEQLTEILEQHRMWLEDIGGKRANLRRADLYGANLYGANLYGADLCGADLRGADLYGADLREANLYGADLREANLYGADLREANLRRADLYGANLYGANLYGADLCGADLREADLREADLCGANLYGANSFFLQCPEEGSFIGFKKCRDEKIVKLLITEDAKRSSATTRKCRCSKAKVLDITDIAGNEHYKTAQSCYDSNFIYEVGKTVEAADFNENRWEECSAGIHFFITRNEAVQYDV